MSSNENIREAIKKIAETENEDFYGVHCVVDSVDETALTCDCIPINGAASFLDVKLQASDGNGIILIPKEGSTVMVQPITQSDAYVSMYSQCDRIQLLNGEYGGLTKISDLVSKLNNLENDINSLKTAFASWVVVLGDGGTALKAIAATWYASSLTPTVNADLENEDITHGTP